MALQTYNKATAAVIAQAATQLIAAFWLTNDPELVQSIGAVITAALVYLVPNKPA